jgi:hypothetical protein
MDATGKLVMESILETKAATILQFFARLARNLGSDFEELGGWPSLSRPLRRLGRFQLIAMAEAMPFPLVLCRGLRLL